MKVERQLHSRKVQPGVAAACSAGPAGSGAGDLQRAHVALSIPGAQAMASVSALGKEKGASSPWK